MTDWQKIGRRVALLRRNAGLTQDALAEALGYSRSLLGELERGTEGAGLAFTIAIADHFKVPLDWLLGRTVPANGPQVAQFIDSPDELAWVAFWRSLDRDDRVAAIKLLKVPTFSVASK